MRISHLWTLVLICMVACDPACGREWVDSTGKYRIEAELVAVRGDKVILENQDGRILSLPLTRLSAADRAYLRKESTPKSDSPPTITTPSSGSPSSTQRQTDVPSRDHQEASTTEAPPQLATEAFALLKKHCARCHGENESDEGGFGFALDREKLVSSGYVLPRDPKWSPLLRRMASKDSPMPPEGESPRPSSSEIATITDWIRSGAPSATATERSRFESTEQTFARVATDLKSVDKRDRPFARYFSTVHLANAGRSQEELNTYKLALAKLINSLSWNRQLAKLTSVGSRNDLFRIDLRDLKWSAATWEEMLSHYPHGLVFDSRDAFNARVSTSCEIPVVRADWFVASASRPPLYHLLAQIPSTDKRLEDLLRVNVQENIDQGRTIRAGFARSGVSQNNRLVERHESIFGAYWKSYDFAGNTGRKNLFENPLGPGSSTGTFAHDGGEIIFRLPNGMLGYMLTDQNGRRIDRGPIEIVSDPRQPDRTVVNGVSCMSCHYGGFIQKSDEIRQHVLANESAYQNVPDVLALYPEPSSMDKWIKQDTTDYLAALAKPEIGMSKPTRAGEPIVLVANRYQNEVDLKLAAAELGLPQDDFEDELDNIANDELKRTVGALKIRGGVVKRQAFDDVFLGLATSLKLGMRSTHQPANIAKSNARSRTTVARSPRRPVSASAVVPREAEDALRAGIEAMKQRQWQVAEDEFEIALDLSSNTAFVARIYEHAIPLYERRETVTPLIHAHKFLLDLCGNSTEIEQARNNLYHSLFRFVDRTSRSSWVPRRGGMIDWRVKLPTSVSSVVANVFETQLQESPDQESALRVMQTYWQRVHDSPQKRTPILVKLYELHHARGERLDVNSVLDLTFLLTKFGDPRRGAEILAQLSKDTNAAHAATLQVAEAESWSRAGENEKAVAALKSAQRYFDRTQNGSRSTQLSKIGDLYLGLSEPARAKDAYRSALKHETSAYRVRAIQEKIAKVIADASDDPQGAPSDKDPVDRLLDPLLSFRMEAESQEKNAAKMPSLAFHNLAQAAKSWIKAEEPKRANAALEKAALALRRNPGSSAENDHASIAELFQQVGQNQSAVNHWLEALKHSQYDHNIRKHQAHINLLLDENPDLHVAANAKHLTDPKYQFRVMARKSEKTQTHDPRSEAGKWVDAAEWWSKAEDAKEVQRVGVKAESAIGRMDSNSSYAPQEQLCVDLAQAYQQVGMSDAAIKNYVSAIGHTTRDDQAVKLHAQIVQICEQTGASLPTLDAKSSAKLDPLNRYRVQAADQEQRAENATHPSSKMQYWMSASKSWLKANDNERALKAADRYASLLMTKENASEYDFSRLGEHYHEIGNTERAIKAFRQAVAATKSDSSKKRLGERINALR